jgi:HPt (histidine-containing phosphotransfer) domain-containing protein/CheY-like chemotaxis protein
VSGAPGGEAPPPAEVLLAGPPADLAGWLERRLGGTRVEAVQRGRDALERLARDACAVLVVDRRLVDPGPEETLRGVRGLDLRDMAVLLCLDADGDPDRPVRAAEELGVTRVIHHPVDREELAGAVAALLGRPAPAAEWPEADPGRVEAAFAAIRTSYLPRALERLAGIEELARSLGEGDPDPELRAQAHLDAHTLAGSMGTFGFREATRLARRIEGALHPGRELGPREVVEIAELSAALRRELEGAAAPEEEEPAGPERPPA